jgi:hypothetical protein
MDTSFVSQLFEYFESTYGLKIDNAEELFESQRNLLEYLICLGRELENKMIEELGKGYQGATVDMDGGKYKFVGYRDNSLHGLFGEIRYQRAYYVSQQVEGGSWIPLDEQLLKRPQKTTGLGN